MSDLGKGKPHKFKLIVVDDGDASVKESKGRRGPRGADLSGVKERAIIVQKALQDQQKELDR